MKGGFQTPGTKMSVVSRCRHHFLSFSSWFPLYSSQWITAIFRERVFPPANRCCLWLGHTLIYFSSQHLIENKTSHTTWKSFIKRGNQIRKLTVPFRKTNLFFCLPVTWRKKFDERRKLNKLQGRIQHPLIPAFYIVFCYTFTTDMPENADSLSGLQNVAFYGLDKVCAAIRSEGIITEEVWVSSRWAFYQDITARISGTGLRMVKSWCDKVLFKASLELRDNDRPRHLSSDIRVVGRLRRSIQSQKHGRTLSPWLSADLLTPSEAPALPHLTPLPRLLLSMGGLLSAPSLGVRLQASFSRAFVCFCGVTSETPFPSSFWF